MAESKQVARLARLWYGSHAEPAWPKWTIAEAQEIFCRAGLDGDFWKPPIATGNF